MYVHEDEFITNIDKYLDLVEKKEFVFIVKGGRPIGVLTPASDTKEHKN